MFPKLGGEVEGIRIPHLFGDLLDGELRMFQQQSRGTVHPHPDEHLVRRHAETTQTEPVKVCPGAAEMPRQLFQRKRLLQMVRQIVPQLLKPGRDLLHRSGTAQKFEQFDAGESILQGIVPPGSGGNLFKAVKQPLETAAIRIEKHIDRVETAFPQKPFQQFAFHGDRELVTALPRSHQKFAVDLRLHQEDLSGFHNSPDAPLTDQQRSFADIFHRKGRNTPAPVVRSGQKLHLVTPFAIEHLLLRVVDQERQSTEKTSTLNMPVGHLAGDLRLQPPPTIEASGIRQDFHMVFFQIYGELFQ